MMGEKRMRDIVEEAISYSNVGETEVTIFAWDSFLTRFANSYIHQNMGEKNLEIGVRAMNEKRIGEANTNRFDSDAIKNTVLTACNISEFTRPIRDLPGLTGHKEYKKVKSYYKNTEEVTPLKRAEIVKRLIKEAAGFDAYGSFPTSTLELAIGNSNGMFAYNLSTFASLVLIVMRDSISSYGCGGARNVDDLDYDKIARDTVQRAKMQENLSSIEPGEYDVVLNPLAVVDIVQFLAWLGFGALAYQEKRSFMSEKLGKKIMGDNITIWDDGLSEQGMPFPFDFEGTPKKKVMLIENGVARGVVYDRRTAKKEGKESTGHSIGSSYMGPYPTNLFMKGENSSLEKMIEETKKGIYVTRFHYTNPIDPITATITGMTRDGTFLIEDGKITKSLSNLRFTQSLIDALSRVTHLSPSVLVPDVEVYGVPFFSGIRVPGLRIERWKFTGVSEIK